MTKIRLHSALLIAGFSLFSSAAYAIEYHYSSTRNYQIYGTTWYNSAGQKIGIQIHYNIRPLMDQQGRGAHYAAVCVNEGSSYAPCLNQTAKVWTKTLSSPIGTWVTQNIPLDCSAASAGVFRWIMVHQPYFLSGSDLNFHLSGGSPYRGTQLFYRGSSDTATLQVQGCHQVLY